MFSVNLADDTCVYLYKSGEVENEKCFHENIVIFVKKYHRIRMTLKVTLKCLAVVMLIYVIVFAVLRIVYPLCSYGISLRSKYILYLYNLTRKAIT